MRGVRERTDVAACECMGKARLAPSRPISMGGGAGGAFAIAAAMTASISAEVGG